MDEVNEHKAHEEAEVKPVISSGAGDFFGGVGKHRRLIVFFTVMLFSILGTYLLIRSFASPGNSLEDISLDGTIQHLHVDDFKNGTAHDEFYIITDDKKSKKLLFTNKNDEPDEIQTGTKIHVNGKKKSDDTIVLAAGGMSQPNAKPGTTTTTTAVTGPRKTLVIMANFTDNTSQVPSVADFKALMMSATNPANEESVDGYYRRNSSNAIFIAGVKNADIDIFGWTTINSAGSTSCGSGSYRGLGLSADSAAQAAGYDLTQYNEVVHVLQSSCVGALAEVGGKNIWLGGGNALRYWNKIVAHEFGHTLGLTHAHGSNCTDEFRFPVSISNTCTNDEYGDNYDVMGLANTGFPDLNAGHKSKLGWLLTGAVATVSGTGDFTLDTYGSPAGGIQVLKIPRVSYPGETGQYYYVEYRPNIGVLVRFGSGDTSIVDTTPETGYPIPSNFDDGQLAIGRTLNDKLFNVSITPLSISANGSQAKIHVATATQSGKGKNVTLVPPSFATGTAAGDATCIAIDAPVGMSVGPNNTTPFTATITLKNTGTTTWTTSDYQLVSLNNPADNWGLTNLKLTNNVAPGGTATFTATNFMPAQKVAGFNQPTVFNWRLQKISTKDWFGAPCIKTIAQGTDVPPAVNDMRVASTTASSVTLNWTTATLSSTDYHLNPFYYKVLRVTNQGQYLVGIVYAAAPGAINTITDSGLTAGTTYTYQIIQANNWYIDSAPSANVTTTTTQ